MSETEEYLIDAVGGDELKEIGQDIAEVIRAHGLHKRPALCRVILSYMSDVIESWNCV